MCFLCATCQDLNIVEHLNVIVVYIKIFAVYLKAVNDKTYAQFLKAKNGCSSSKCAVCEYGIIMLYRQVHV